jgi:thiol-disulfide isomerase/thioredoxin
MRAALAIVLALALAGCAAGRRTHPQSPLVGKPVEVSAHDLGGREHRVEADVGKVRVVDFWATWCDPCRDQLPFLDRMQARYGERGLAVYAVSFDESRAAVEKFLQEAPLAVTVLWDPSGDALSERLAVTRLPTTLLVDRRGVVRDVHLGFEKAEEAKLEEAIRRLLAERP